MSTARCSAAVRRARRRRWRRLRRAVLRPRRDRAGASITQTAALPRQWALAALRSCLLPRRSPAARGRSAARARRRSGAPRLRAESTPRARSALPWFVAKDRAASRRRCDSAGQREAHRIGVEAANVDRLLLRLDAGGEPAPQVDLVAHCDRYAGAAARAGVGAGAV